MRRIWEPLVGAIIAIVATLPIILINTFPGQPNDIASWFILFISFALAVGFYVLWLTTRHAAALYRGEFRSASKEGRSYPRERSIKVLRKIVRMVDAQLLLLLAFASICLYLISYRASYAVLDSVQMGGLARPKLLR
jgi:hypothetical protein